MTEYHSLRKDIYFIPDTKLLKLCENTANSLSIQNKCYIGRIITGEASITHNEREILIKKFNPLCVDMESASVAHTFYVNSIPFIAIRSMSDNADENGAETFEHNIEMAANNSIILFEELIRKLSVAEK